jgi:hypothetical protein
MPLNAPSRALARPARQARRLALTGLLAALVVALVPGTAGAATPYGTNLVKNPGAENGLTKWSGFNDPSTRKYGAGGLGYPSKQQRDRIGGGTRMFTAGAFVPAFSACGELEQTIRLNGISGSIDSGKVKVRLKGWMATSGAADLTANVLLLFRDGQNHSVSVNGIGGSATTTNEVYRSIDKSRKLPKGTRILRLKLFVSGSAMENGACEVAWDKLSVVITRV